MGKILLDYVFPVTVIDPIPAASTAFLKQVCVVAKPKSGQEGNVGIITQCTSMTQVAALTDNQDAQQFFNAGLSKVYVLLANDLDLESFLVDEELSKFYTLLVSDDFDDDDLIVEGAYAEGTITITNYANLVDTGDDTIEVAGVVFTASSSPVTPGQATFRAATSDEATAQSLADQINAHAVASTKVTAVCTDDEVAVTAKEIGAAGNALTLAYSDEGTSTVGATVSGSGTLADGVDEALQITVGEYEGVIGISTQSDSVATAFALKSQYSAFISSETNKAKNMFFAFGSLLANTSNWANQQYIEMPFSDSIVSLGDANTYQDAGISFVLSDDEFGDRLAFFAVGKAAIVAPYILKNLRIDIQSRALTWISANQPQFTLKEASLLETRLQIDVINEYIEIKNWIESGKIEITLENSNFIANGDIEVAQPKALWRVTSELRQTV